MWLCCGGPRRDRYSNSGSDIYDSPMVKRHK